MAASTILSRSTFFSSRRACSARQRRKNTSHGCQFGDSVRIWNTIPICLPFSSKAATLFALVL